MTGVTSTDELERTIIDLDNIRLECESYRSAWLRAERQLEDARAEVRHLKKLHGSEDTVYLTDIAEHARNKRGMRVPIHAVRNWIVRYPAFPTPQRTKPISEWDKQEILDWLASTERGWEE